MGTLFGGGGSSGKAIRQFKPVGISAGGLNAVFDKKRNLFVVDRANPKVGQINQQIASLRKSLRAPVRSRANSVLRDRGDRIFLDSAPLSGDAIAGINADIARLEAQKQELLGQANPRDVLLDQVSSLFRGQADEISGLRSQVTPGFGRLTEARRSIFEEAQGMLADARRRAVGDLRENLARRRVLGSSFAEDAVTRAEAEFSKVSRDLSARQAEAEAQSFLQELQLSNNLLNQQFEADRAAVEVGLNELNLETNLATTLATKATAELGANARALADLRAREAEAQGSFLGTLFSAGIGLLAGGPAGAAAGLVTAGASGNLIRTDAAGRILGGV